MVVVVSMSGMFNVREEVLASSFRNRNMMKNIVVAMILGLIRKTKLIEVKKNKKAAIHHRIEVAAVHSYLPWE